jgi:hypothetical protein
VTGYTVGGGFDPSPAGLSVSAHTAVVSPNAPDYPTYETSLGGGLGSTPLSAALTFGEPGSATATNTGSATTTPPFSGLVRLGLSQSASVSGSASPSSNGALNESLATTFTLGILEFTNAGTAAVTVDFEFSYIWSVLISGSTFPDDYAEGVVSILLDFYEFDIVGEPSLATPTSTPIDVFELFFSDLGDTGGDSLLVSGSDSVTIGAGKSGQFRFRVDAAGYASAIPTPAAGLLLGFGLLALRRVRARAGVPA